jgi:hypothetical protein
MVDGTQSYDPDGDDLVYYAWDFDDDGVFETPGMIVDFSAAGITNPPTASVFIHLKVCDEHGLCDIATAKVVVLNFLDEAECEQEIYGNPKADIWLGCNWATMPVQDGPAIVQWQDIEYPAVNPLPPGMLAVDENHNGLADGNLAEGFCQVWANSEWKLNVRDGNSNGGRMTEFDGVAYGPRQLVDQLWIDATVDDDPLGDPGRVRNQLFLGNNPQVLAMGSVAGQPGPTEDMPLINPADPTSGAGDDVKYELQQYVYYVDEVLEAGLEYHVALVFEGYAVF